MNEISWIFLGVFSALLIALIVYPSQVYVKMRLNKTKIRNTFLQIEGQVGIKNNLLKEYIEINKDTISEEKYKEISERLNSYSFNGNKSVDSLKDFNDAYSHYMKSFDDALLHKQCEESQEKINYIKDYYNELVCFYNRYKSNGVNSIVSKVMAIEDEKLY